jgi:hypothetical protein
VRPRDVVLKTVAVHAAGTTRYLPLDPASLVPGEIALGLRVDCGMDDAGEREQLHLHLSLRIGGAESLAPRDDRSSSNH